MTAITEGSQLKGESGRTYLAVGPLGQANVWTAVDTSDHGNIVVVKSPTSDDNPGASWPHFQHEMIMHELFKDCDGIRKLVDRIPPVKGTSSPPMLVLEIFETTLWQARAKRPFSPGEIKAVCRGILHGLKQVHSKGLVYADLKMPNVMLSGFNITTPGDGSALVAKLGDLGIVMPPCNGKVQPVAYRAPEIYFKGEIAPPADIWAFGLVCCHLLEAQHRFSKTGLYDDLENGGGSMPEREQAMRYAIADDYDIKNVGYYKGCSLPYQHEGHPAGNQWNELRKRGLDAADIKFLQWVLESDPTKRPTATEILQSSWFKGVGANTTSKISSIDGAADKKRQSSFVQQPKALPANNRTTRSAQVIKPASVSTITPVATVQTKIKKSTPSTKPTQQPQTTTPAKAQDLGAILANLPGGNNTAPQPTTNAGNPKPLTHGQENITHTSHDTHKRPRLSDDFQSQAPTTNPTIPASTGNNSLPLSSNGPVVSSEFTGAGVGTVRVPPPVIAAGGEGAKPGGTYLSYR